MKAYKILGFTDEMTTCGCCGKANLKGTYVMQNNTTGDITYFGRSCGAKAAGWDSKEMNKIMKSDANEQKQLAVAEFRQTEEYKFYTSYIGSAQHGLDIKTKGFDYVFELTKPYDIKRKEITKKYNLVNAYIS